MSDKKLYKLAPSRQPEGEAHFENAVVCALNARHAKEMHPNGSAEYSYEEESWGDEESDLTWVAPSEVACEWLGFANDDTNLGLINAQVYLPPLEYEEDED